MRPRSTATIATAANDRFGSGCTRLFHIAGGASGAAGSGIGTQVPSPSEATFSKGGA